MQKPLSLQVRQRLRAFVVALMGFTLAVNLLLLVSPLYMLQVYDRVLSSGSTDTLIWLTGLAVFLLIVYGAAEAGRRRVAALIAQQVEATVVPYIFASFEQRTNAAMELSRNLARLGRVQTAMQSGSLLPFVDLPFAPLFLIVLFLIHPVLGLIGIGGALLVFGVAFFAEVSTRQKSQISQRTLGGAGELASGLQRQRSAIVAMGLLPAAFAKWRAVKQEGETLSLEAAREDGKFTAISRSSRQVLQIFILGGGAALALSQEISAGSIVASSIVLARALGPIDQIVGSWRNSVMAWQAWRELEAGLDDVEPDGQYTPMPRPKAQLTIDRLAVTVPGSEEPLIRPFTYALEAGQIVTIAGGNGVGKTTLLQTLSGAWPPGAGTARLGGRSVHDWSSADRGRYVGYVPQQVELLPATVAENIGRLAADDPEPVFAAARAAGAHEMISALPSGYDTPIGPGGCHLSAGQKQLIGLARALYGDPVLLLLDEPTANLDAAAAPALVAALAAAREAGAMVLVSTHDRRVIESSDTVLLIRNGAVMHATAEEYLKLAAGPGATTPGGQGAVG